MVALISRCRIKLQSSSWLKFVVTGGGLASGEDRDAAMLSDYGFLACETNGSLWLGFTHDNFSNAHIKIMHCFRTLLIIHLWMHTKYKWLAVNVWLFGAISPVYQKARTESESHALSYCWTLQWFTYSCQPIQPDAAKALDHHFLQTSCECSRGSVEPGRTLIRRVDSRCIYLWQLVAAAASFLRLYHGIKTFSVWGDTQMTNSRRRRTTSCVLIGYFRIYKYWRLCLVWYVRTLVWWHHVKRSPLLQCQIDCHGEGVRAGCRLGD